MYQFKLKMQTKREGVSNFNTSHVSVQAKLAKQIVSLIPFQYISCISSRSGVLPTPPFLFNFNTSHVSVQEKAMELGREATVFQYISCISSRPPMHPKELQESLFQYISCISSRILILFLYLQTIISIHLMYQFKLYLGRIWGSYIIISIHLMYQFKSFAFSIAYLTYRFQYISCISSRLSFFRGVKVKRISIHLMYQFKCWSC